VFWGFISLPKGRHSQPLLIHLSHAWRLNRNIFSAIVEVVYVKICGVVATKQSHPRLDHL
jgi:hypothetical protein